MGIPLDSTLIYSEDTSVELTVVEPRRVEFAGEVVALSRATMEVRGLDYYVAPTRYWTFEGRSLNEIYNETYPVAED